MRIKIDYSFYKDSDLIPIDKVAELLGLNVTNGKIICPCHDDHNPSASLSIGQYNSFKCWVCGERGGPLELTMAVKYGVNPSDYYESISNKEWDKYKTEREESALFLDEYFQGAITYIEDDYDVQDKSEIKLPTLSKFVLDEIGLQRNFYTTTPIKPQPLKRNEDKKFYHIIYNKPLKYEISDVRKAEIIIDKIDETINKLIDFRGFLIGTKDKVGYFVLDEDGEQIITNTIKLKIEALEEEKEKFEHYLDVVDIEDAFNPDDLDISNDLSDLF